MASFSGMNFNGSANVLLKAVNKPPFIFMPDWQKSDVAKAVTGIDCWVHCRGYGRTLGALPGGDHWHYNEGRERH